MECLGDAPHKNQLTRNKSVWSPLYFTVFIQNTKNEKNVKYWPFITNLLTHSLTSYNLLKIHRPD